jgi:hypothetical protein
MATKMADIQRQLERAAGLQRFSTAAPGAPVIVAEVQEAAASNLHRAKAPSREGKIHIGAYLHPDFKKSLRLVQARTGKDIQGLLADALNDLFRAHNAPVIDGNK